MTLSIEQLSKRVGDRLIVDVPSLSIATDCFLSVVGQGDEGLLMLVRLIGGLEMPTTGTVQVDNRTLTGSTPVDRGMTYVSLPDMLDVLIAFGEAPATLPPVLLVDDLRGGRDQANTAGRHRALERIRRLEVTVIYATDDREGALTLSNEIAVVRDGRLVQMGSPGELCERPKNIFVATLFGFPPMNVVRAVLEKDGCAVQVGPRSIQLPGEIVETYCHDVFMGVRPENLRLRCSPSVGWPGQVVASQTHGGRTYVEVEVDGARLVALVGSEVLLGPGDQVGLTVTSADLYVFDERGDRLEIR